jgi:hypothetical protein
VACRRGSSHAAGANLRRLRTDGFAEADPADGWSWWRPTDAGIAAAACGEDPAPESARPPLCERSPLVGVVSAFNRGDRDFIAASLASDIVVDVPGSGAIGEVFRGANETMSMVEAAEARIQPDIRVLDLTRTAPRRRSSSG